jgi:hypothetical protein
MCTNHDLETRIVILEAALDWVRHEATRNESGASDPRAMARIAAIATQVLEDDEVTLTRRLANARDRSGIHLRELQNEATARAG